MDKNSVISLKVIQTDFENHTNTIELMSESSFYKKDDVYYIVYDETDLTGMEGTTTTVKIEGNTIKLIRFGTVTSNFIFQQGIKHICDYVTQYGIIQMGILANKTDIKIDQNGGELFVDYEIEVDDEKLSYNSFYIKVSARS